MKDHDSSKNKVVPIHPSEQGNDEDTWDDIRGQRPNFVHVEGLCDSYDLDEDDVGLGDALYAAQEALEVVIGLIDEHFARREAVSGE